MIGAGTSIRTTYESLGPRAFLHSFYQALGLEDSKTSRRRFDATRGRAVVESATIKPDNISLAALAYGIIGPDFASELQRDGTDPSSNAKHALRVMESGNDVVPSNFSNISAYNAAVAGLLEAKVLEIYQRPEFLAEQLTQLIPSNKRSEKFIGVGSIGDIAQQRQPGARHARAPLPERYVETPETQNYGLAIDVTVEAVVFDLTNQVLQQAESVSEALLFRKENDVLDTVLGIKNTYTYGGTSYNTYLDSGNWVNDLVNPFTDWSSYDTCLSQFAEMVDQETGQPISVLPKQIFAMPAKYLTHRKALMDTVVQARTQSQGVVSEGGNPISGMFELLPMSSYAYNRARAADGLALGEDAAKGLWLIGDFKRAFGYIQNIPLTTKSVGAGDYEMTDRGLIQSTFVDEMGVSCVLDPRFAMRNKTS